MRRFQTSTTTVLKNTFHEGRGGGCTHAIYTHVMQAPVITPTKPSGQRHHQYKPTTGRAATLGTPHPPPHPLPNDAAPLVREWHLPSDHEKKKQGGSRVMTGPVVRAEGPKNLTGRVGAAPPSVRSITVRLGRVRKCSKSLGSARAGSGHLTQTNPRASTRPAKSPGKNKTPAKHLSSSSTTNIPRARVCSLPHLERLKLLEHVADDSRGSRLVGVGHGPPACLRAESLAQSANAAPGAKVHLAGDRGCRHRAAHCTHRPGVVWSRRKERVRGRGGGARWDGGVERGGFT